MYLSSDMTFFFSLSGVKSTGADPDDYDESSSNYRQEEIDRFNSTIYVENGKRVFSYYWQVIYYLIHYEELFYISPR